MADYGAIRAPNPALLVVGLAVIMRLAFRRAWFG
jgi:hypothetical protein